MADTTNKSSLLAGFSALNKSDPNKSPEEIAKERDPDKSLESSTATSTDQGTIAKTENGESVGRSEQNDELTKARLAAAEQVTGEYEAQRDQGNNDATHLIAESMKGDPLAFIGNEEAPQGQFHRDGYRTIVDSTFEPEQGRTFFNKKYRRFRVGRFEFRKNYLELTPAESEEFLAIIKDPKFPYEEAVQIVEINRAAQQAAERSVLDQVPAGQGVVRGAMTASDILTAKDKQRFGAGAEFRPGANGGLLNPNPQTQSSAYSLMNSRS